MSGQYQNRPRKVGGGRGWPIPADALSPREFGEDANQLSLFRIKLDSAQTDAKRKVVGNFMWAIDASDLDATFDIKFNRQDNTGIPISQGTAFGGVGFNEIYLTNSAQAGKWVELLVGVAREPASLFLLNAASSFTSVKLDKANTLAGSGTQTIANAATDTIAANTDRRELIFQADNSNTGNLFLRDSNANIFVELEAGQTITLEVTDEVQVRNASGASLSYRYVEVKE